MDIGKSVKDAQESGKLLIGSRSVAKAIKSGNLSKVILAANCPEAARKMAGKAETLEFPGDSVRLGETCGKPFTVLMVGIKK